MFPWTRRMQFWQPCWKVFAKRPKTVPQSPIGKKEIWKNQKIVQDSSTDTQNAVLETLPETFHQKAEFIFKKEPFEKNEDS